MFVFFLPTLHHSGFSQSANVYLWGFYAIVCIWCTHEDEDDGSRLLALTLVPCARWSLWHRLKTQRFALSWTLCRPGPTTASLTPWTCCRERSLLMFMYKQVPVFILFHHINIHDTSEWEMHNCNHSTACLTPKEHYIHIKHLYSLPTQLYKCPKPFSSISHIEV